MIYFDFWNNNVYNVIFRFDNERYLNMNCSKFTDCKHLIVLAYKAFHLYIMKTISIRITFLSYEKEINLKIWICSKIDVIFLIIDAFNHSVIDAINYCILFNQLICWAIMNINVDLGVVSSNPADFLLNCFMCLESSSSWK